MHITLRQLQIFREVAQCGRVTGAAETLHISQPAASMALSELEKHLGPLFDRHQGAGLSLNDAGRALLPKACELIDRAQEVERQFTQGSSYEYGSLSIRASSTVGNNILPKILSQFQREFPGIRTELIIENTRTIEQHILGFETDLAIVEGTCLHPDIEVATWKEDELVIICNPEHPLSHRKNVTLGALSKETWVLREPGSGTRELFDEVIASRLGVPSVTMTLNRAEAVKQAVSDGLGIGCMSRIAARTAINRGILTTIDVSELNMKRYFYLLMHKKKYRSPVIESLCRFILGWEE
ncbi:hypothetical protein ACH42_03750 [Endozoicomonas sp. (ex Bugula neritina AB1)]|nr:hypothetical protein ACH42_03750 [Endozoicomonas sp. (ex Bugula neritina AB1)]